MKISYVIPAYNEEAFIGQCLEALTKEIESNPHDAEIIVVNESTDRTKEIALTFPRVAVIDVPPKGLSAARHAGYLASSGDLIASIDADTKIPKGWSQRALKAFSRDSALVALSGPYNYYDMPFLVGLGGQLAFGIGYSLYLINRFVLNVGSMMNGGNSVIRKSALDKINGYNAEFVFYGEDVDIARRLHKVGRVKFKLTFQMPTSGRRLAAEGVFKMGFRYALNYVWAIFKKKPLTKEVLIIRETPEVIRKSKKQA